MILSLKTWNFKLPDVETILPADSLSCEATVSVRTVVVFYFILVGRGNLNFQTPLWATTFAGNQNDQRHLCFSLSFFFSVKSIAGGNFKTPDRGFSITIVLPFCTFLVWLSFIIIGKGCYVISWRHISITYIETAGGP